MLEHQVLSDKNNFFFALMNKLHDEFDCWLGVIGGIDTRLSSIENQLDTFKSCECKKVPLAADQSRNGLGGTEPLEEEDRQFGFHEQRDNTPKSILMALKSNGGGSTLLEEPGSRKSHEELAKKEVERIKKKDGWKMLSKKVLETGKRCESSFNPVNSQGLSSEERYLKSKNALNSNFSRMSWKRRTSLTQWKDPLGSPESKTKLWRHQRLLDMSSYLTTG